MLVVVTGGQKRGGLRHAQLPQPAGPAQPRQGPGAAPAQPTLAAAGQRQHRRDGWVSKGRHQHVHALGRGVVTQVAHHRRVVPAQRAAGGLAIRDGAVARKPAARQHGDLGRSETPKLGGLKLRRHDAAKIPPSPPATPQRRLGDEVLDGLPRQSHLPDRAEGLKRRAEIAERTSASTALPGQKGHVRIVLHEQNRVGRTGVLANGPAVPQHPGRTRPVHDNSHPLHRLVPTDRKQQTHIPARLGQTAGQARHERPRTLQLDGPGEIASHQKGWFCGPRAHGFSRGPVLPALAC